MAAPITVTDERIVEAGRRLLAEKKLITGWTLRSVVGTGKASRLAAVWAACAEVEAADKVELASPPLPDALEEQAKALREHVSADLTALIASVWQTAERIAIG